MRATDMHLISGNLLTLLTLLT